jgi:hypothetical protein
MTRRTETSRSEEGDMTSHDEPNLDDVMDTEEPATPHRRDHAKAAPHPDEDELDRKTRIERDEVDREQSD